MDKGECKPGMGPESSLRSLVMPDGSILLAGGLAVTGGQTIPYFNDVWRSTDNGATWTQLTANAPWIARAWHSIVVMPNGGALLIGGGAVDGHYKTDVWRFMPTGSSVQNPSHTYSTPGIYPVALQAYKSSGYSSIRKTGYITVTNTPPVPPASITGLDNTTFQQTSITWTWTDPSSKDFSKVKVYLDGVFQTNVTKGIRTYTASSLTPDTVHTIATHTVSTTGLINQTWVSDTARTAPDAPSFGSAFIQSTPSGAKIYLDYTDTGFVTPKTLSNLASGSRIIRCSLNGYDDTTQTVSITSGQTTSVMITLQKSGNVAPKARFLSINQGRRKPVNSSVYR